MEYKIHGSTMQAVELSLKRGEVIFAEAGAMTWMTDGIHMDTNMGRGGLFGGLARVVSGESLFFATFEAKQDGERVAFSASAPGNVKVVDVGRVPVVCQKEAFLCAESSVDLEITFNRRLGTGFFGGEGFVMQKLSGSGLAFVEIDGECVEMELGPNETLRVDTGHVAMFEATVNMDISMVKGMRNMLFGGEGLFLTTLRGPGKVWLQTMPVVGLAARIRRYLPTSKK